MSSSNPTGYLCVDGEIVYIGHEISRHVEAGEVTLDSVSIHNIVAEDVGRSSELVYWEPEDVKQKVVARTFESSKSEPYYRLRLGGNTLYFSNLEAVEALRDYLNAVIDREGK